MRDRNEPSPLFQSPPPTKNQVSLSGLSHTPGGSDLSLLELKLPLCYFYLNYKMIGALFHIALKE